MQVSGFTACWSPVLPIIQLYGLLSSSYGVLDFVSTEARTVTTRDLQTRACMEPRVLTRLSTSRSTGKATLRSCPLADGGVALHASGFGVGDGQFHLSSRYAGHLYRCSYSSPRYRLAVLLYSRICRILPASGAHPPVSPQLRGESGVPGG